MIKIESRRVSAGEYEVTQYVEEESIRVIKGNTGWFAEIPDRETKFFDNKRDVMEVVKAYYLEQELTTKEEEPPEEDKDNTNIHVLTQPKKGKTKLQAAAEQAAATETVDAPKELEPA